MEATTRVGDNLSMYAKKNKCGIRISNIFNRVHHQDCCVLKCNYDLLVVGNIANQLVII